MTSGRLSYRDTWNRLRAGGWIEPDDVFYEPSRPPRFDDNPPWGFRFFRTRVWDEDFSNLTLTRTYMERTDVARTSFAGSDCGRR